MHTVLLVEDDEMVRSFLSEVLEMYGYGVITAATATEAVTLCTYVGNSIDMLISDVSMPDVGGLEFVASIKAISPSLPVLFISGYDPSDMIEKHRAFITNYPFLRKPFTTPMLMGTIQQILAG